MYHLAWKLIAISFLIYRERKLSGIWNQPSRLCKFVIYKAPFGQAYRLPKWYWSGWIVSRPLRLSAIGTRDGILQCLHSINGQFCQRNLWQFYLKRAKHIAIKEFYQLYCYMVWDMHDMFSQKFSVHSVQITYSTRTNLVDSATTTHHLTNIYCVDQIKTRVL